MHEVNILDQLLPGIDACYMLDRGFLDCERLSPFRKAGGFFVTAARRISKSNGGIRIQSISPPD